MSSTVTGGLVLRVSNFSNLPDGEYQYAVIDNHPEVVADTYELVDESDTWKLHSWSFCEGVAYQLDHEPNADTTDVEKWIGHQGEYVSVSSSEYGKQRWWQPS